MKKSINVIFGLFLTLALGQSLFAKEKVYRWKLAMTWPNSAKPLSNVAYKFAKDVKEMSNGRLIVKVDDANKHKAPLAILDMVKAGNYQMGHSCSYYWKGKDINTVFFTSMPFGMNANEQYAWFYYGGGEALMKKVYDKQNVYSFPGGSAGVQMGGWFRKPIKSLKDLKGLKMRIPGFAGEIMAKVGVNVTNIAPGELYTALERGTIDALEWVSPALDLKMGFAKITPYYYTGWHEPASDMQFMINKKAYDKLPSDLQAIVKTAMMATAADDYYENTDANAKALAKMKKEFPNVKIMELPTPVLKAMKKANDGLIADLEKRGGLTKEIIDSQRKYLNMVRKWTDVSEYYYMKNMINLEKK